MRIPFLATLVAPMVVLPMAASAQDDSAQPPQRIRSVAIKPGETCPASTKEEVVVCPTIGEPYRIPSALRERAPSAANQSWVNRTATMDQVGRVAAGLPDTCSPVGTGGQSGCALSWNRAYAGQMRENARAATAIPGGE